MSESSSQPAAGSSPLSDIRAQINALDDQLIALLARRYALLPEVVRLKQQHNIPHRVPARVEEVIARNVANGTSQGLPERMVREVWDAIIEAAHRYEVMFLKD